MQSGKGLDDKKKEKRLNPDTALSLSLSLSRRRRDFPVVYRSVTVSDLGAILIA